MRIWDVFLYGGEADMLECRLVQFSDFPVWRHVLAEAPLTHQGHPKPLWYAEQRDRFAPWQDKIIHIVADTLPGADPMQREAAQRDAADAGLAGAGDGDWVILADVDEIPNAAAMAAIAAGQVGVLEMTCCVFAADWVWGPLRTSPVMPAAAAAGYGSLSAARRHAWSAGPALAGCGHHLTWMGGRDKVLAKLAAHCHTETNGSVIAALDGDAFLRHGANPFDGYFPGSPGAALTPVDVDDSWPRWVRERRCPPSWFRPRETVT